jgi:hypothetical protein
MQTVKFEKASGNQSASLFAMDIKWVLIFSHGKRLAIPGT